MYDLVAAPTQQSLESSQMVDGGDGRIDQLFPYSTLLIGKGPLRLAVKVFHLY